METSQNAQDFDYLLVLDFEAQCSKEEKLKVQEIIELPVIVVDVKNQVTLESFFHTYVKPYHYPQLSEFCKELTGITQDQVDQEAFIQDALKSLDQFLEQNGINKSKFVFVTCGDWDLRTCLKYEARFKQIEYPKYLKKWINLKNVFQDFIGAKRRVDMLEMLKEFNIPLEGRHHSGIDDARNISKIVLHLLKQGKNFTKNYVAEINEKNKK